MSSCTGCGSIIDINSIVTFVLYFFVLIAAASMLLRKQKYQSKKHKNEKRETLNKNIS